jgi:site-specific DNA recombinase
MTAVIYARYSSDNQREESIEGQIRECTAYAEKNDITIVKHYIDRAISAKTDNRPQFQQMIKDSDKKLFDIVLVWKLDRFARNRYDSARYKTQLKKNGVKLMSATEIISEGPEGIILESVLEGYAEYYSADLAEKVVRGQTENILKGRCNGGRGTFGYTLDSERKFHIDPLASPFVLESFTKYRDGLTMKEIRDWLNENGIKNPVGGEFTYNSVEHMLKNRRYIGELKFRDVVVPDAIPPIVPLELFDDVQEKIAKNKKAPARRKAEDDYLLTTKLHCGCCGALMFGESGTSRTGEVHRYYKCATAKKKKGCKKKTVRKQWLEDLVVNQTMQLVRDDAAMESIIAKVMELQDRENTNLPLYEKQLRDAESGIQNMLNAIQAGILTSSTKERLEQLEETKRELEARIAEEKLAKPKIKEEFIRFWLMRFRKLDMSLKDQRQALVDTFINSIYLYDDKVLITFNYKEGTQTITFEEAAQAASKENGSDLDCFTAPENAVKSKDFMAFLFCKPWVHGFCTVFARSVLSMSDYVGRCIALQSVPFFASGEQGQAELCLHFRVGILEQFQKSRHGDGGFACGGYSLRAGGVGLGVLLHPLHGTVDGEGAHTVGSIKVDVLRGQTCHLPFPQRTHQRQMQDRILHAVQCRPHLVHLPDAALLGGLFGRFHRDRAFDEDAPLHRQQKGIVQKLVDLIESSAGEGALLLLGQQVHQELCHRHGGRRPSIATPIRASFCRRTGACRICSQPLFRISRNQGVTH